jgi:hypothetical protein
MRIFWAYDNLRAMDDEASLKDFGEETVGFETSNTCDRFVVIGVSAVNELFVIEGIIDDVDPRGCEGLNNSLEGYT